MTLFVTINVPCTCLVDGKDDVDVLFSAVADFEYIDELNAINNTEITKIAVNNIKSKAGFTNELPLHSHTIYYSFSINIEKTNRIWEKI
jgi:hypothetical protein